MGSATVTPKGAITSKHINQYTGRYSGPQQFDNFTFTELLARTVPKPVPMSQPVSHFQFEWVGRIVIGTANISPVNPESLLNLFQNIRWVGTHATLSSQTPWNGSGATLFKLMKLMNVKGNDLYINGVRISDDILSTGIPAATFGNTGTYDIDLIMTVPVFPFGLNDSQAMLYVYNEQAWGSTMNMFINMGDKTGFGTIGTSTVTYTAFGSGTGSPQVNVNIAYASLGPLATKIGQAVCVRNDIVINSVLQSNSSTIRLALLQNQRTTFVAIKTGTLAAGTTSGVTAYATLSDVILQQTVLRKNNQLIRNLFNNSTTKSFYGQRLNTVQPVGYLGILFDDGWPSTNAWAAYQGDNPIVLPAGAQFDIASQVIGAAGANFGEVIQEYILGQPVVALNS